MNGLTLIWNCTKCNTRMVDAIGMVCLYTVNGLAGYIKMKCDNCSTIHYVNYSSNHIISESNVKSVELSGSCCF